MKRRAFIRNVLAALVTAPALAAFVPAAPRLQADPASFFVESDYFWPAVHVDIVDAAVQNTYLLDKMMRASRLKLIADGNIRAGEAVYFDGCRVTSRARRDA